MRITLLPFFKKCLSVLGWGEGLVGAKAQSRENRKGEQKRGMVRLGLKEALWVLQGETGLGGRGTSIWGQGVGFKWLSR